jgi:superfamily I DNA and RNA helicase
VAIQYLPGSLEIDNIPYDREIWTVLTEILQGLDGYCAYKIPVLGATSTSEVPTFIVVTKQLGVMLLDVVVDEIFSLNDDARVWSTKSGVVYSRDVVIEQYCDEMVTRFKRTSSLYSRKEQKSLVPVTRLILCRENTHESLERLGIRECSVSEYISCDQLDDLKNVILQNYQQKIWQGNESQFGDILSLIEGTWDYKATSSHMNISKEPRSINDLVTLSLNRTFKQDNAQRQVSMQIPNGPQRIRGLAGTGKTVVLSLKAALTALRLPNFKVLYLFNTQSLYNLVERQIGDYYAKEAKASLPPNRIDILHAWGGRTSGEGLYSKLCEEYGLSPLTLRDVGRAGDALAKIFNHLKVSVGCFKPVYDLVLIDEAQDFPNEVFEVVYEITKDPKRIVVAYDDFQSLKDLKIREFEELFGVDQSGKPRFPQGVLTGEYAGGVAKDFVLPNCYRNPRNILMVAHGVALGVERESGVVDSVDRVADWKALGYKVNSPINKEVIQAEDYVEVERLDENSTNLLEKLLSEQRKVPKNLIQIERLESIDDEVEFVAQKIKYLVTEQEVPPHDIFVIAVETRTSETFLTWVRSRLNSFGIKAITPGYVESNRHFHEEGCVVLTTPFRAKGNEANIVFVSNCQCVPADVTFSKRNSFFVSATRSRGWLYITGVGESMERLKNEIQRIQNKLPKFSYIRPSDDAIARRRLILSRSEHDSERNQELLSKIAQEDPELFREFVESILSQQKK